MNIDRIKPEKSLQRIHPPHRNLKIKRKENTHEKGSRGHV